MSESRLSQLYRLRRAVGLELTTASGLRRLQLGKLATTTDEDIRRELLRQVRVAALSGRIMPGLPEDERACLFETLPPPPVECGSDRGYQQHRHRKETACDDCKRAHAAREKERAEERARARAALAQAPATAGTHGGRGASERVGHRFGQTDDAAFWEAYAEANFQFEVAERSAS